MFSLSTDKNCLQVGIYDGYTKVVDCCTGQVHSAVLHDGREVAVKIQYPGVARGIESDIDNLVGILKVWNILPEGISIAHSMYKLSPH